MGLGYVGLPWRSKSGPRLGTRCAGFEAYTQQGGLTGSTPATVISATCPLPVLRKRRCGTLTATCDFPGWGCDCAIICVPTPLDAYRQPDISYVKNSAGTIAQYAHPGIAGREAPPTLAPPRRWWPLHRPVICGGADFFLAFSPSGWTQETRFTALEHPEIVGNPLHPFGLCPLPKRWMRR